MLLIQMVKNGKDGYFGNNKMVSMDKAQRFEVEEDDEDFQKLMSSLRKQGYSPVAPLLVFK